MEGETNAKIEVLTEAIREFTINLFTNTNFTYEKIDMLVGVKVSWEAEIKKGLGA